MRRASVATTSEPTAPSALEVALIGVRADVSALRADVAAVRALLERESPRARPTENARQLLLIIAGHVHDRAFVSLELAAHAQIDPDLRRALVAAGLTNVRKIGKWLRRIERDPIAGFRLERIGTERDGIVWRLHVYEY